MLDNLWREALTIVQNFSFIRSIEDFDRTDNALRFRLIIFDTLFIQVYANSQKNKLYFALISSGQRIYGRDNESGLWHKHPFNFTGKHDFEGESGRGFTLTEFIVELEDLLLRESLI
jgi:hypothetical protein